MTTLRDRVARRIYDATPGAENDPWDAAVERRADFGLAGPGNAIATAYAQADAALAEVAASTDASPAD